MPTHYLLPQLSSLFCLLYLVHFTVCFYFWSVLDKKKSKKRSAKVDDDAALHLEDSGSSESFQGSTSSSSSSLSSSSSFSSTEAEKKNTRVTRKTSKRRKRRGRRKKRWPEGKKNSSDTEVNMGCRNYVCLRAVITKTGLVLLFKRN